MAQVKEKKPKNDRDLKKFYKCYDCGEAIKNLKDMVEKKVVLSVATDKLITRTFHLNCLIEWQERALDMELITKEDTDWDKVYQYFKKEYLNLENWRDMTQHAVNRMRGLRIGQYYPRGNNTKILKRGYSYDTIHKAMIVARPKAMSIASGMSFSDMKHKIDFFMKFITSEIEDVQLRIDKMNKVNESTDKAALKNKDVIVEDHVQAYTEMVKRQEEDAKRKKREEEQKSKDLLKDLDKMWGAIDYDEDE